MTKKGQNQITSLIPGKFYTAKSGVCKGFIGIAVESDRADRAGATSKVVAPVSLAAPVVAPDPTAVVELRSSGV